jgi:UDP:flavonoid glycosyltransferase YjiC (YdhE family)
MVILSPGTHTLPLQALTWREGDEWTQIVWKTPLRMPALGPTRCASLSFPAHGHTCGPLPTEYICLLLSNILSRVPLLLHTMPSKANHQIAGTQEDGCYT